MDYAIISIVKCKKNRGFIQKILHLYHLIKACLFCQRGRLAHWIEMSTGHFLYALPSHKLKNSGTSVVFSRPLLPLVLSVLMSISAFSQAGGTGVYAFLNLPTSARQSALGGDILTLTDDVNQAFWNPATINDALDGQTAFNYVNFLGDISYLSACGEMMIDRHTGTFFAGITYLNYGELIEADEQGNETGTFKAYDLAVVAGYAYHIPRTGISAGVNVKLINSVIAGFQSIGIAADAGIYYHNDNPQYTLAAVIRNAGTQITSYDGTREPLPLKITIGGSTTPEHVPLRWYWAFDDLQRWKIAYTNPSDQQVDFNGNVIENPPGFFDNLFRHFSTGVELFPGKGFNLRMGYNAQRAKELRIQNTRTFAGLSFGFGLRIKSLHLDYSYVRYHPVSDSHHFGLRLNLFPE